MPFAIPTVCKVGHKQGLTCENPASGGEHFVEKTGVGVGAIAHFGFELNAFFHVQHGAGLGDHGFARIELNFNNLDIVAYDFIIDFV